LFAGAKSVPLLSDLARVDKEQTLRLTGLLVERGIAPLPRGMMYLSAAHTDDDIALTVHALSDAIVAIG
jgi:glutamate-1-semialdehyde 2,1-aminomutase